MDISIKFIPEVPNVFPHSKIRLRGFVVQKSKIFTLTEAQFKPLHSLFSTSGISLRISCLYTHEQSGSSKRKHRYIVEMGLSLLANVSLLMTY